MGSIPLIGGIIKGVTGYFKKKQELKSAEETAKIKIKQAHEDATNNLALTDAEWESLAVSKQDSTWKDEYITLIITLPIPMILLGAVYAAFTGDVRLLTGVNEAIDKLKTLGMDWGELMYTVTLAAVGLKVWRQGK
jgi:hypothetical protein